MVGKIKKEKKQMEKNKYIIRTDLFIKTEDLKIQDEKGNVYFNTKDRYLTLTLDNTMRVTFNSTYKGQALPNADFQISGTKGIILRIKNKTNYPYYDLTTQNKKEIDYIEIVNILKTQWNAVETTELQVDFSAIKQLGLKV